MTPMDREPSSHLIVVVGPSGAGKDTVLQGWRSRLPAGTSVHFVRRVITRSADPLGENHEPVSEVSFAQLLADAALAFHWQAHGLRYGVRSEALAPLARNEWVVLNGSREYLPLMRQQAPALRVVEITAPHAVLAQRLQDRSREAAPALQERLSREVPAAHADLTLVNDGQPGECAEALHRWWLGLTDRKS